MASQVRRLLSFERQSITVPKRRGHSKPRGTHRGARLGREAEGEERLGKSPYCASDGGGRESRLRVGQFEEFQGLSLALGDQGWGTSSLESNSPIEEALCGLSVGQFVSERQAHRETFTTFQNWLCPAGQALPSQQSPRCESKREWVK